MFVSPLLFRCRVSFDVEDENCVNMTAVSSNASGPSYNVSEWLNSSLPICGANATLSNMTHVDPVVEFWE